MEIIFWEDGNGFNPVDEFLDNVDDKARKKILRDLSLIETTVHPMQLKAKLVRKISGYEQYCLYEIRIPFNRTAYRILCHYHELTYILVHGFKKDTQKTPSAEIQTAIRRVSTITTK